jgi:tetratricopeptide (TPR) repeat protein
MIGARHLAMRLFRKTYKRAVQFEVFDIAMLCALALRREAYQAGETTKFIKWDRAFTRMNDMVMAEAEAEKLYHRSVIHFVRSGNVKVGQMEFAQKSLTKAEQLKDKFKSYYVYYNYFNLKIAYLQLAGEYENAYKVFDEFEKFLVDNPQSYSVTRRTHFLLNKIDCSLYVRRFDAGQKCITEALKTTKQEQETWFVLMDSYFMLCMITGNFTQAAKIYFEVISADGFLKTQEWRLERWKLFTGYLWFALEQTGNKKLQEQMMGNSTFRLSKLVNEIPIYSRDKKGYNVASLLMQVANLISGKEYVEIITRTESLRRYLYETLKRDPSTIRSQIFIRMILALAKYEFDLDKAKPRIEKLLNALRNQPVIYSPTQAFIEVIPYENLWEMIEQALEKQGAGRRKVA